MYICKNCYLNLIWTVVHVTETTEKNNLVITDMYNAFCLLHVLRFVYRIQVYGSGSKNIRRWWWNPAPQREWTLRTSWGSSMTRSTCYRIRVSLFCVRFEDIMKQFYDLVNMLQDCSMSASIGLLMRFCSLIILHLFCHSNLAISSTSI